MQHIRSGFLDVRQPAWNSTNALCICAVCAASGCVRPAVHALQMCSGSGTSPACHSVFAVQHVTVHSLGLSCQKQGALEPAPTSPGGYQPHGCLPLPFINPTLEK